MSIKKHIVDQSGIKLWRDDILVDEFGDEWIICYDDEHDISFNAMLPEYSDDFYLRRQNTTEPNLLSCIRTDFAQTMKLKRKPIWWKN